MATIRSYTTIEQSKVLAEILPLESADAHYVRKITDFRGNPVDGKWSDPKLGNPEKANYIIQNFTKYETIPAWSLSALLDALELPTLEKSNIEKDKTGWMVSIYPDNHRYDSSWYNNPVDACYEMILKLYELNLL